MRRSRGLSRQRRVGGVVLGASMLTALFAGCSSSKDAGAHHSGVSTPAAPTAGTPTDDPTSVPNQPAPTLPPITPHKVNRPGRQQAVAITAGPAPFTGQVVYPDGVTLRIVKVEQGVTTGSGPGALPGRPRTAFTIELTNRSAKPIDMNRVVVTVAYGPDHNRALPIYDDAVRDFSGTAQPGGSPLSANYAFSIPTNQLSDVTMTVDFDGLHASATFDGVARAR